MKPSAMFTAPISTTSDSLELIGGKGRSLAKMVRAGFSVPGGFLITADAYRTFINDNALHTTIIDTARADLKNGYPAFDQCAEAINTLILQTPLAGNMIEQIADAYTALDVTDVAVAVRSSANAEDLPEFSFAGQQETFLNVRGEEALLAAVHKCWASLWTAQAISYRHQNGIDQDRVAMAVVVQIMVPSAVSGILFTANPTSGERSEMIINASYGLGEAIVGGQVTPDTYIVERPNLAIKESILGPKEQQIVYDGAQGIRIEDVSEEHRGDSSMSPEMLQQLATTALKIEHLFGDQPQDIEWAFFDGDLYLLQSRPITNLPVQPIEVDWTPRPPARLLSRRQIVENMPDPVCPLFEELYLTKGLEAPRQKSLMVGGGPMFVTLNGYAYQRFDWPQIIKSVEALEQNNNGLKPVSEEAIDAAEYKAQNAHYEKLKKNAADASGDDLKLFREELNADDQVAFDAFRNAAQAPKDAAITLPQSQNATYVAFNHTAQNDGVLKKWYEYTKPRLENSAQKWRQVDVSLATDQELLDGICEMGIEEGRYWSDDSSHTFGVAKSTDDQLQCFLKETLPEHNFISGQFLTGIASKAMQANADLFDIAKLIRADDDLRYTLLVVPSPYLMQTLRDHPKASAVVLVLESYLATYGHQGYSMDFIEPTQSEEPSALFATLKGMVRDKDYHPKNQSAKTLAIRSEKLEEISNLLSGLEYWQFRFRLWLALKYNYIREEVAFRFGFTWSILRPMAHELGARLTAINTLQRFDDIFFLISDEIVQAINARRNQQSLPELGRLANSRRELRDARKLHHPPGTLPPEVSQIKGVSFKETQIKNDDGSEIMRGFPVSSGTVTGRASVILGPTDFDNMVPGSILVSPLTTPAWTQLFAHASGLVTDIGSILAHGSIVAREYGIPAVLGVGNGTQRIKHGQWLTIDGNTGTVTIHDHE
jgi:phosphohistidine swiveling domain-containing protein